MKPQEFDFLAQAKISFYISRGNRIPLASSSSLLFVYGFFWRVVKALVSLDLDELFLVAWLCEEVEPDLL